MVKNTKGGKGAKSLGRKHQTQTNHSLRLSTDPLEKYAFVTKMYGGGMCEIWYIDEKNQNKKLIGHIRKKMKGRQMRHNCVVANSYVLVGLRDWESEPKNCDIICIYDTNQIEQLKQNPSVNIIGLSQFSTKDSNPSDKKDIDSDDNFEFGEIKEEDKGLTLDIKNTVFEMDNDKRIDIDDI